MNFEGNEWYGMVWYGMAGYEWYKNWYGLVAEQS